MICHAVCEYTINNMPRLRGCNREAIMRRCVQSGLILLHSLGYTTLFGLNFQLRKCSSRSKLQFMEPRHHDVMRELVRGAQPPRSSIEQHIMSTRIVLSDDLSPIAYTRHKSIRHNPSYYTFWETCCYGKLAQYLYTQNISTVYCQVPKLVRYMK